MKTSAWHHQSISSAVARSVAVAIIAVASTFAPQALAQGRGNSGLPFGPGNPMADLQRQIDELKAMIGGPGEYSTVVNCIAGEKVQDALNGAPKNASRVIVTINGVCAENVSLVDRDDVWLQGASPDSGIQASTGFPLMLNAVARIQINDLTIMGGAGLVLRNGSTLQSRNLVVKNTQQQGISVSRNSTGFFQNLTVQNSGLYGLHAFRGGEITMTGGQIIDNTLFGVMADGGQVSLTNVTVQRNGIGAMAQNGGMLWLLGTTTVDSSSGFGVNVGNGSSAFISGPGVWISNSGNSAVNIDTGSTVSLTDHAQVRNNPNVKGIAVGNSSAFNMTNGAIVEGNKYGIDVVNGSSALITDGSQIRNNFANGISINDTSVVNFNSGGGQPAVSNNGNFGIFCQGPPAVAQFAGDVQIVGNPNATNCPH